MKKQCLSIKQIGFIPLLLLLAVSAYPAEKVIPVFDDRDWQIGERKNEGNTVIENYVTDGQNIGNALETITIKYTHGLNKKITLEQYVTRLKEKLDGKFPAAEWRFLRQSSNEWMWIVNLSRTPRKPGERMIARAVMTEAGLHLWAYSSWKKDVSAEKKEMWIENLKRFRIENADEEERTGPKEEIAVETSEEGAESESQPKVDEVVASVMDIKPGSVFSEYLNMRSVLKALYQHSMEMDKKLGVEDENDSVVTLGKIIILKPVKMSQDQVHPLEGIWFHRYELTKGGKQRTYNYCFIAQGGEPPTEIPMIMGTSLADPMLAKEVLPAVYNAAFEKSKENWDKDEFLKEAVVSDSIVTKGSHAVKIKGKIVKDVWTEEWQVSYKQKDIPIPITFIPDKKKGTLFYVMDEEKTIELLSDQMKSTSKKGK